MPMKNSNDTFGNRTRDLPTCSAVPQPTALPRTPTEMSTMNISSGAGVWAENLTTFLCWLLWNLGAWTSWNPQGLSRPVMGLICLFLLLPYEQIQRMANFFEHNLKVLRCQYACMVGVLTISYMQFVYTFWYSSNIKSNTPHYKS